MKKLVSLLMALVMILGLGTAVLAEADTYELALVTDIGTIDDKSFNQSAWEGLVKYAEENGISYKYYQPEELSVGAYLDSIQLAVDGGAKVVVTPGFLFGLAIYTAQDLYPDVSFILIDGEPNDGATPTATYRTGANVASILYAEEEAGYLAGYAAVKEGFTKLGFMGGVQVPAVIRFGYGFAQGADAAAVELGLTDVTLKYTYVNGFLPTPEVQTLSASWYTDGTEVIFAAAGGAGNSAMAAAEATTGKYVIGVDKDQSGDSPTVITSAMKGVTDSVYQTITAYYAGEFPGGVTTVKSAANNGVQLPMDTSHFTKFTQADYDAIFAKLFTDEAGIASAIKTDSDVTAITEIPMSVVQVTVY